MPLVIYHNPRCSKSRQTLALIEGRGVPHRVVEYLKEPPSARELKRILGLLGLRAVGILRNKEALEAGIDASALSESALIDAMVAHPAVIERPIVVADGRAVIGRPPEKVLDLI